jgi:hypothetical protein
MVLQWKNAKWPYDWWLPGVPSFLDFDVATQNRISIPRPIVPCNGYSSEERAQSHEDKTIFEQPTLLDRKIPNQYIRRKIAIKGKGLWASMRELSKYPTQA